MEMDTFFIKEPKFMKLQTKDALGKACIRHHEIELNLSYIGPEEFYLYRISSIECYSL